MATSPRHRSRYSFEVTDEGWAPARTASAATEERNLRRPPALAGRETRGYDAGKTVRGRKRHTVVDPIGLLLVVNGHRGRLARPRRRRVRPRRELVAKLPGVKLTFTDGGCVGWLVEWAKSWLRIVVKIDRKPGSPL